jgi:hypothetical protein
MAVRATHRSGGVDMSEQLTSLSQSIVEIAKEVDGHITDYKKNSPKDDKAALVSPRFGT